MLAEALATISPRPEMHGKAAALIARLENPEPYPQITVGVHGGLVQWTLGNPFPIRICDYDGCPQELPDVDERGQRCAIWFAPPQPTKE